MEGGSNGTHAAGEGPGWSAGRKHVVQLGLPRGAESEQLGRRLGLEPHRITARQNVLLDGGNPGLNGDPATTEDDRRLRGAERKIGKLTPSARA